MEIQRLESGGLPSRPALTRIRHRVAARFPDGQLSVNLRGYDLEAPMPPEAALAPDRAPPAQP